jgi:hypothetical protein
VPDSPRRIHLPRRVKPRAFKRSSLRPFAGHTNKNISRNALGRPDFARASPRQATSLPQAWNAGDLHPHRIAAAVEGLKPFNLLF